MSLATVREGIKRALDDVDNLNVYGFLALFPSTPCAVVGFPDLLDPGQYMGQDGTIYEIPIAIYVGLSDDKQADLTLCGFVDDVLTVLDLTPTLNGACSSTNALRVDSFGRAPLGDGGPEVLGCLVVLEVFS